MVMGGKNKIITILFLIVSFLFLLCNSCFKWIAIFEIMISNILSISLMKKVDEDNFFFKWHIINFFQIIILGFLLTHFVQYSLYALISFLLEAIVYYSCLVVLYGYDIKCWKIENIFLILAISFGTFMTLNLPIKAVPDERTHVYTAYAMSDYILNGFNQKNDCFEIREQDEDLLNPNIELGNSLEIMNWYYSQISHASYGGLMKLNISNALSRSRVAYILPGIAIAIGRILNFNAFWTLMSGRIINFLFYIFMIFFAIKLMPFSKLLPLTISLYPMAIQQGMSYSYDCMVLSLSMFIICGTLFYKYGDCNSKKKNLCLLPIMLSSLLLFNLKSHSYIFISLIPLVFILSEKKWFQKVLKISACFIGLVCTSFLLYAILDKVFCFPNIVIEPSNPIAWAGGVQGYTIQYFMNDPFDFIVVILRTLKHNTYFYFASAISSYLGWLNIGTPFCLAFGFFFLSAFTSYSHKSIRQMNRYEKFYVVFLIIITFLAITLALLIDHTYKGVGVALGVQGRYFLPLIFPMLLMLPNNKSTLNVKNEKVSLTILSVLILGEIYFLIIRF